MVLLRNRLRQLPAPGPPGPSPPPPPLPAKFWSEQVVERLSSNAMWRQAYLLEFQQLTLSGQLVLQSRLIDALETLSFEREALQHWLDQHTGTQLANRWLMPVQIVYPESFQGTFRFLVCQPDGAVTTAV